MTPELIVACEVVFQEHKHAARPVAWNRDVFRGRLSTGMSEKAKETLLQKQIICYPNPARKSQTLINPAAMPASTFTEAEGLVMNRIPALAGSLQQLDVPAYTNTITTYFNRSVSAPRLISVVGKTQQVEPAIQDKWYLAPVWTYVVWPLLSAIAGGIIAYMLGEVYTEIMFNLKR